MAVCVDVWVYIPPIQHPLAKVLVGGEVYITRVFVRIKQTKRGKYTQRRWADIITSECDYHFDYPGVLL